VARNYFKLLAYKDEYEVARLFADPAFRAGLDARFEGGYTLRFHLAPTFLARPDPDSGRIRKIVFGPGWKRPSAGWPARRLRGTPFDPFGYHPERKAERALIAQYEADIGGLLPASTPKPAPRHRPRPAAGGHPRLRAREGVVDEEGRREAGRAAGARQTGPPGRRAGRLKPPENSKAYAMKFYI
jgi:hypothetical protein